MVLFVFRVWRVLAGLRKRISSFWNRGPNIGTTRGFGTKPLVPHGDASYSGLQVRKTSQAWQTGQPGPSTLPPAIPYKQTDPPLGPQRLIAHAAGVVDEFPQRRFKPADFHQQPPLFSNFYQAPRRAAGPATEVDHERRQPS